VAKLKVQVGEYAKKVGQLTLEKDWAVGKLQSLDSSYKKELIDRDEDKVLSVVKQCNLISYNRSNLFYAPMVNPAKDAIKKHIEKIETIETIETDTSKLSQTTCYTTCFYHNRHNQSIPLYIHN
jgi:putative transposase